jgi:hypothetical protein
MHQWRLKTLRISAVGMTEQPNFRRKPTRMRPTIDGAYAAIKRCRALTQAALALGMSRGHLDRMVSRSPRLSWLVSQMREEIVDLAEVQFARKIQEGSERCILAALSSPIARRRGWAVQGTEAPVDAAPRHTTLMLEVLPPTGRTFDHATGQIIEHKALESDRAEGGIVVVDVAKPEDDTPEEAA